MAMGNFRITGLKKSRRWIKHLSLSMMFDSGNYRNNTIHRSCPGRAVQGFQIFLANIRHKHVKSSPMFQGGSKSFKK